MVDDTKAVHAFVRDLLSKVKGIELVSVFNGRQAVDRLLVDQKFDLILLDWEMPILTGPDAFLEFIKMGINIPTVMMTTKSEPEDIQKMLQMGVAEYLMKPFTIDILLEKIEFVTGRSLSHAA